MKTNRASLAVLGMVAVLVLVVMGPGRSAASRDNSAAIACTLLSAPAINSVLGYDHSVISRNVDKTVAISEAVNTECNWDSWSGPAPTTPQTILATGKSGHGAQLLIQTWAPHKGSPNVQKWLDTDYDSLTGQLEIHLLTFPGVFSTKGLPATKLTVPHFGHDGAAFTVAARGRATGLTAAVGCWWEDKLSKAICLVDEEATFRPAATHLIQIAKLAVPKFL